MKQSPPQFDLSGRVALITGAGGHLGSAMAVGMAIAGCHVILNGRRPEALEELQRNIQSQGGEASVKQFDVTDDRAIEEALADLAQLDILVNNAYAGGGGTTETASRKQFQDAYDLSVSSAAILVQKTLPLLRKGKSPDGPTSSVIHLSSMYGNVSPNFSVYETAAETNPPFYGAAKAAVIQLTRYQANELAPQGVRVNAICPGPFPASSVQSENPDFTAKLARNVPLGRIGQAKEMVGPLLFLASEASSYVTGSVITVDGGWTCR